MSDCRERLKQELARRVLLLAPADRGALEAGADIVATDTPHATTFARPAAGTEPAVREVNVSAARIARTAADEFTRRDPTHPRFVAGILGVGACNHGPKDEPSAHPTESRAREAGRSPAARGQEPPTFDHLAVAYRDQAEALLDGGVDILWFETDHDARAAKAALFAIRALLDERGADVPVCVSVRTPEDHLDRGAAGGPGQLADAASTDALWTAVRHTDPFCFGLSIRTISDEILAQLPAISPFVDSFLSLRVDVLRADLLRNERNLINILGAGSGATPEQIAMLAEVARAASPRPVPRAEAACRLSGREALTIRPGSPFVKIGERANVAGSARFAHLIRDRRHTEALEVVRRQIEQGAQIIDLNFDDPQLDAAAEMASFLQLLAGDPKASRVPVMIDSADWRVLEAGAKRLPGRGVVNSICLKDGEEEFIRRARRIHELGAVPVLVALDAQGPAMDRARKVEICTRSFQLVTERAGFAPQEAILDPAILTVGTGLPEHDDAAMAYIEACRTLRETLPECLISGGVSNLSFAFRGNNVVRAALHVVFLHHAIPAGMNVGIVNVARWLAYEDLPEELREAAEDVVLNRRPDAAIRLARLARHLRADSRDLGPTDAGGPD
ncbi:MAG: dihydropteroate synthase [Candidatus Eisenbacteria sp.]|nr:dihydropteroate synthase [Candidatus Eisenbacteria bacterium]